MADIELVIKIAEESYKEIKKIVADRNDHYFLENIIANGTPLPKGYGDLEDRPTGYWIMQDELFKCSECGELSCCKGKYCNECGAKMQ